MSARVMSPINSGEGGEEGRSGFSQGSFVKVQCRFKHESLKLEVVDSSKVVASHIGLAKIDSVGV
jgi:hypothetical protein